ncbi:MAG TPA: glutamate 5-kinase [Haliangiales bacterium]|nr:glutamate 5-kinase [Haliangiales bacterium]
MHRERLVAARRVVVKIGSRLIHERPDETLAEVAAEVAAQRASRSFVVVSSGAIALGRGVLGLAERPRELARLQAVAAVGQGRLMQAWERAFSAHGIPVGQVLLTHDDVADRARFLSARHALAALLDLGAVPIVNENDTVATDEIKFGDNDRLAALTVSLTAADALVILTDVDGLHDAPPAQGGRRVPLVRDVDREAAPVAGAPSPGIGTGGMASKVQSAKIAGKSGVPTVVARGGPGVVGRVLAGEDVGTLFLPSDERLQGRKHWIAYALKPAGVLVVDAGARAALVDGRKSLLPSGIREVRGAFAIGDAVSIRSEDGAEFARGLASYAAEEIVRIRGRRSADIEPILGYKYLDEVVHRDDLVIL